MKTCLILFLLLLSNLALGSEVRLKILSHVKLNQFSLGIGSRVQLHFVQNNAQTTAIFLGRMADHPDLGEEILFLDESNDNVLLIDGKNLKSSFTRSRMQGLVSTIDQTGETCAAYAIYHYWQQTDEAKLSPDPNLRSLFSEERSKMKLLEESISRYYIEKNTNLKSIMRTFGDRFGFKCEQQIFLESNLAIDYVYNKSLTATPVMMEFNLGPNMVSSPFVLHDFETGISMDPSLWIPRKVGQRRSGGHVVVAAAGFMHKGRKKILVLDSNWNEPRVWDLESYFAGKTAIDEMVFHSCDVR